MVKSCLNKVLIGINKYYVSRKDSKGTSIAEINGNLVGDTLIYDTVIVSSAGQCRSRIIADTLEIWGRVFGDVEVSNLIIRSTGKLFGHALYQNLKIEEGGILSLCEESHSLHNDVSVRNDVLDTEENLSMLDNSGQDIITEIITHKENKISVQEKTGGIEQLGAIFGGAEVEWEQPGAILWEAEAEPDQPGTIFGKAETEPEQPSAIFGEPEQPSAVLTEIGPQHRNYNAQHPLDKDQESELGPREPKDGLKTDNNESNIPGQQPTKKPVQFVSSY
ncbi:MAG: polymer-forming cytoskeletal protein [Syntrophomonadaceae bacterium]